MCRIIIEMFTRESGDGTLNHLIEYLPQFSRQTGNEVYALQGALLPSGSVKYISVLGMLNEMRQQGVLKGCRHLVASSSGNTVQAAAYQLRGTGIHVHAVIDPRTTEWRKQALRALDVDLIEVSEPDPIRGYLGARLLAVENFLQTTQASVDLNQYTNCGALNGHYQVTGPWIWRYMKGQIDVFVAPIGTGGTFGGTAFYLSQKSPSVITMPVDCEGSAVICGRPGPHLLTGIGAHFACENARLAYRAVRGAAPQVVNDQDAIEELHWLRDVEGIHAGGSGGAALFAVRRLSRRICNRRVVVIFPDGHEAYQDTLFSPSWLTEHNIRVGQRCAEVASA
jgi:cysteine synthase